MAIKNTIKRFPRDGDGQAHVVICESSGLKTASAVILDVPGILVSCIVYTDGASDAEVTVYDNASAASGVELAHAYVKGSERMGGEARIFCEAENGIYLSITGSGAKALIRYLALSN